MSKIIYEDIDCRTINLKKAEHKNFLDGKIRKWRDAGLLKLKERLPVWERIEKYYEGKQVPVGYSDDALKMFVEQNSGKLLPTSDNWLYFPDNKIKPAIDRRYGEYVSVRKNIQVASDKNPKNNKIEWATGKYMEKFEEDNKLWQQVKMPCVFDQILLGLSWSYTTFNPFKKPFGAVKMETVSAKDVLLDSGSKADYYTDTEWRIRLIKMKLSDCKRLMAKYGVNDDISPDEDYEAQYTNNIGDVNYADEHYVTVYMVEYRKVYDESYSLNDHYGVKKVVPAEVNINFEDDFYFFALFTEQTGTFFHSINKYKRWFSTPYQNKRSRLMLYPIADAEPWMNINDIVNITNSLILDNTRQQNIVRAVVKSKFKDKYGDIFDRWVRYGGDLPVDENEDVRKAVQFLEVPDLAPQLIDWLQIATKVIDDQSQLYAPLKGEYPEQQMSGIAITKLKQENRRVFSYLDEHINWSGEYEGGTLYKMVATEFKEEDFVHVTNTKPGEPDYIPINSTMTLAEFEEFLVENYADENVKMALKQVLPQDPQLFQKKMMILQPIIKKFEEYNEVDYHYQFQDNYGAPITPDVVWGKASLVFINQLEDEENMSIKIKLDFDADGSQERDQQLAAWLYERYPTPKMLRIFLEAAGGGIAAKADEILADIEDNNQIQQLAEKLSQYPELMQTVAAMVDSVEKANLQGIVNGKGQPLPPNGAAGNGPGKKRTAGGQDLSKSPTHTVKKNGVEV